MSQDPGGDAARRLSAHLRMDPQGGVTGVTTGPEPELVVFLYTRRNKHWPTTSIPTIFEGFRVRTRKTGRPRPAI